MKALALLFLSVFALTAADSIEALGHRWTVPNAADWEAGTDALKLLVGRPPTGAPRRPSQFAVLESPPWETLRLEVEVKRNQTSLIIVYAWQDAAHYNYAHLSVDAAQKQPVHNGIFHVFGGERVRISRLTGPGSLLDASAWHKVRLDYSAATGEVRVNVNGQDQAALHAVDLSLGAGKIGLGSFGETGEFRNLRITGKQAQ